MLRSLSSADDEIANEQTISSAPYLTRSLLRLQ